MKTSTYSQMERNGNITGEVIMVIESRKSVNTHYFDTKSLIWLQIFIENLSMPIAMNIGKIKFLQI